MADIDSPPSSELSDVPSIDSEHEDELSTAVPSSRPSVEHGEGDHLAPPPKRRKTGGPSALSNFDRGDSQQGGADPDDDIALSEDGFSDAPGSPTHDERALREEAQTQCLWRDCPFGQADNNDELVTHVQGTHCATGGPKKTKYVCEWGECQRKTSNHPSGYALKAHMRSHTKEKPYYCALPECDKAFTRSDALAKHMRTVHEPEQPRGGPSTNNDPTPPGKGKNSIKLKLSNGSPSSKAPPTPTDPGPTIDEDGNTIVHPSPAGDNITYIPAHHPITGQPGFMIHYPPDIQFTAWESSINADQLMRLLRRQLNWAEKEAKQLQYEVEMLEQQKKQEWTLKEILLEGVMEGELARGMEEGIFQQVDEHVLEAMEKDVQPSKQLAWTPAPPPWRRDRRPRTTAFQPSNVYKQDTDMRDAPSSMPSTPDRGDDDRTPSPPATGKSGGFDGDNDPYDNYLGDTMAHFERLRAQKERERSTQNTPLKQQADAEADAVGALMGMSGGKPGG